MRRSIKSKGTRRPAPATTGPPEIMGASEFKARCLEVLDRACEEGAEFVITKRGKPVARLSGLDRVHPPLKGALEGRIEILGDIVGFSTAGEWEAAE